MGPVRAAARQSIVEEYNLKAQIPRHMDFCSADVCRLEKSSADIVDKEGSIREPFVAFAGKDIVKGISKCF